MTIIRHTDAEVLQEIAAIIWPPSNPYRDWDADTMQDVADALLLLRPDLAPWSLNCLVYHSWVENALDCAEQRCEAALDSFNEAEGTYEAVRTEEDAVDALTRLIENSSHD